MDTKRPHLPTLIWVGVGLLVILTLMHFVSWGRK